MQSHLKDIKMGVSDALDVAPDSVVVTHSDGKITVQIKDIGALASGDIKSIVERSINEIVEES